MAKSFWGEIEKLKSGRYRARYTGPDHKRYSAPRFTFSTKMDAQAWLAAQHTAITSGTWTPNTAKFQYQLLAERAQTLREYASNWISARMNIRGEKLKPRTRSEYERLLRTSLASLADLPLAEITRPSVQSWYTKLEKTGARTTAARAYGLLRSVLQTAQLDHLISENPCTLRGASSARTGKKVIPPTYAELQIIESVIASRFRAAVVIAAWGGLRFGELTALKRKDISFDGNSTVIQVERAVTRIPHEGFIVSTPKSAAGVREVILGDEFVNSIKEHLDQHVAEGEEALLFPAKNAPHLSESTFTRYWYPARATAGRPDMPWHALRHHSISAYAAAGATTAENMRRHGQSTASVNMDYQHSTGRERDLANRMMASVK